MMFIGRTWWTLLPRDVVRSRFPPLLISSNLVDIWIFISAENCAKFVQAGGSKRIHDEADNSFPAPPAAAMNTGLGAKVFGKGTACMVYKNCKGLLQNLKVFLGT